MVKRLSQTTNQYAPPPPIPAHPPLLPSSALVLFLTCDTLHWVNLSRCLRRFLAEVFPREQETERDIRRRAGTAEGRGHARKGAVPPPRYGSAFRRLYGHAAYSVAAFLLRMCGGALKGLPLRELVETFFEGVACRPVGGGGGGGRVSGGGGGNGGGGTVGTSGGTVPHADLMGFAVMHLPDLLQCFSEVGCAGGGGRGGGGMFALCVGGGWLALRVATACKGRARDRWH